MELLSCVSGSQPPRRPGLEDLRMGTERDCMLQLAAEAFQARNFDLAADIYACQLGELGDLGSRLDLLLKRADALAFGGKLSEAFGVYREAAGIETLRPPHLEKLVQFLTERVRQRVGDDSGHVSRGEGGAGDAGSGRTGSGCYTFSCRMCLGFLFEPVTLACGHTFCKKCLEREKGPVSCRECRSSCRLTNGHSYRVNVVLNNLLTKWFPGLTRAARLRREGNGLYAEKKMEAALEKYNEAILIAPRDHILFSNRSQILNSLRLYEDALRDAEKTCSLMPYWSKGHVRRAQALVALGRTEEALREYLLCLSLEADCRLARTEAHKLLSDLLAPDQVPDSLLDSRSRLKNIIHTSKYTVEQTHILPAACTSKHLCLSKYLSESKLSISSAINYPQSPSERSEGTEVKGHGKTEGWTVERALKRKRRSGDEEGGERREDWKRSKPESSDVIGSWSSVVGDLIDPTDLECSLCMRLFYEPVTTPCGHSFCLQCLERCLDHNPKCPLCKEELSEYLAQRQYHKTVLMESLIFRFLPSELSDRQQVNQEELAELSNLNQNLPIFVCTMAFPTVPCPLHIFEPCYRLMIRRCMETGTKRFGMCLADNLNGFADYGCLLEIRNVEFFSDGRSVVDTIGRRRFKVLQHQQRDGYNTADIEYIEDIKVVGVAEQELRCLHDTVYEQALRWVDSLTSQQKQRIVTAFGHMPDKESEPQASPNGPSWCWWLLAVLPLEGRAQLPFLALTSLKERLSGIRRVLLFMARSRHR